MGTSRKSHLNVVNTVLTVNFWKTGKLYHLDICGDYILDALARLYYAVCQVCKSLLYQSFGRRQSCWVPA
jgi:hypothetical protein